MWDFSERPQAATSHYGTLCHRASFDIFQACSVFKQSIFYWSCCRYWDVCSSLLYWSWLFLLNRCHCLWHGVALSENLHPHGILLQVSALRRLFSALVSHLRYFFHSFALDLQTQMLEEHLGVHLLPCFSSSLDTCPWPWLKAGSWLRWVLNVSYESCSSSVSLVFYSPYPNAEKLLENIPKPLPWLQPGISYRLEIVGAMNSWATSLWLPGYTVTPQNKPPFLKYGALMVTEDVVDQPWQHLLPWCLQLPAALGLAASQSGYGVLSVFKPVPHWCIPGISQLFLLPFHNTMQSFFAQFEGLKIYIFIFKQVALCTELWRAATEGCVHEAGTGSWKKKIHQDPSFLSLTLVRTCLDPMLCFESVTSVIGELLEQAGNRLCWCQWHNTKKHSQIMKLWNTLSSLNWGHLCCGKKWAGLGEQGSGLPLAWLVEAASKAMGSCLAPADHLWKKWALTEVLNSAADQSLVTVVFFRSLVGTQKSILPGTEHGFLWLLWAALDKLSSCSVSQFPLFYNRIMTLA